MNKRLTFKEFINLPWLHIKLDELAIFYIPEVNKLRDYVLSDIFEKYKDIDLPSDTLDDLYNIIKNDQCRKAIYVTEYKNKTLLDVSFQPESDFFDRYVVDYYADDNEIFLSDV